MGFRVKCRDSKYNGSGVRVKSPATCKNQSGQPTEREQKCAHEREGERENEWSDRKKRKGGKKKGKSITPQYNVYGISCTVRVWYTFRRKINSLF